VRDAAKAGEITRWTPDVTGPAARQILQAEMRRPRELAEESTSGRIGSREADPDRSGMPVASVLLSARIGGLPTPDDRRGSPQQQRRSSRASPWLLCTNGGRALARLDVIGLTTRAAAGELAAAGCASSDLNASAGEGPVIAWLARERERAGLGQFGR
jgi:hypothetical protein